MTYRDNIKQYFLTGAYPTQAQFWEFFDKIPFKDEGNAGRITKQGVSSIDIPTGSWVDKIAIYGNEEIVVSCGRVADSNDVFDGVDINGTGSVNTDQYFPTSGTLFFTGVTPNTTIIIFTR